MPGFFILCLKLSMAAMNWNKVPEFYHNYIRQVAHLTLAEALTQHGTELPELLHDVAEEKWVYRYAPGKWSIKEVVQHIIDAERIFCYRALSFARGEKAALPGFDENEYAAAARADNRTKTSLLQEFNVVQQGSSLLFASFDEAQLAAAGTANNNSIYVEAIGYIVAGHCRHHIQVLRERYLQ
jgi:hypothetical protein